MDPIFFTFDRIVFQALRLILSSSELPTVLYEACPESRDTKVLYIYMDNIFNLQKRHCE